MTRASSSILPCGTPDFLWLLTWFPPGGCAPLSSHTRKFNLWWTKLGYLQQEWWTVPPRTAQKRDLLVLLSRLFTNCLRVKTGAHTNTFPSPFKIRSLLIRGNHFDVGEDGITSTRQARLRPTHLLLMFIKYTSETMAFSRHHDRYRDFVLTLDKLQAG